jgi:mannose-6-phosphate isomerase/beta-glucosidase
MLVSVVEGCGEADGCAISKGDNFIIPSGYEKASFTGNMKIIASTPGQKEQRRIG